MSTSSGGFKAMQPSILARAARCLISLLILSSGITTAQAQRRALPVHHAGEQLLKTKLYTINADAALSRLCYTDYRGSDVYLSMVYDVSPDHRVDLDAAQLQREIIPALGSRCSAPKRVNIKIFIKGVRIGKTEGTGQVGEEYGADQEPPLGEAPLILFMFVKTKEGTWNRYINEMDSSISENDEPDSWSLEGYRTKLKRQKQLADTKARQKQGLEKKPQERIHYAGAKLFETELYELYTSERETLTGKWCDDGEPKVSLVSKAGADHVITDKALRQLFEEKILPTIKQQCALWPQGIITVYFFAKGVRIGSDNKEYAYDQTLPGDGWERPFNWMEVPISSDGQGTNSPPDTRLSYRKLAPSQFDSVGQVTNGFYRRYLDVASLADFRKKFRQESVQSPAPGNTSSSELNLNGIGEGYKKLFRQIYDEDFLELSDLDEEEYAPYVMFSGLITNYSDMCRSSLSPSAKQVDVYRERYMYTDYSFFSKTEYYERYLSKTVYMEPEYELAYRTSPLTALKKLFDSTTRASDKLDANVLMSATLSMVKFIPLADNTRRFISNNKCGSPTTKKFMDNLHKFVAGDWDMRTKDGYRYLEAEDDYQIKRAYPKVPPTFSPKFPVLNTNKELMIFLNLPSARKTGIWTHTNGLGLVTISKIGSGIDLSHSSFVKDLRRKLASPVPEYVWDALREQKYYVATCVYPSSGKTFNYWNASGPLPSAPIQAFFKDLIREPIDTCPTVAPEK